MVKLIYIASILASIGSMQCSLTVGANLDGSGSEQHLLAKFTSKLSWVLQIVLQATSSPGKRRKLTESQWLLRISTTVCALASISQVSSLLYHRCPLSNILMAMQISNDKTQPYKKEISVLVFIHRWSSICSTASLKSKVKVGWERGWTFSWNCAINGA